MEAAEARLGELGYAFIKGQSGNPSDWVLRQIANTGEGFEWKGQENYDEIGAAVTAWAKVSLATIAGERQRVHVYYIRLRSYCLLPSVKS